jgi:hypothetical protein
METPAQPNPTQLPTSFDVDKAPFPLVPLLYKGRVHISRKDEAEQRNSLVAKPAHARPEEIPPLIVTQGHRSMRLQQPRPPSASPAHLGPWPRSLLHDAQLHVTQNGAGTPSCSIGIRADRAAARLHVCHLPT